MHEKGVLQPTPTQNFQMMRSEPCEEYPNINMVLRSDETTGGDAQKEFVEDVKGCNVPTKEPNFEVEQGNNTLK